MASIKLSKHFQTTFEEVLDYGKNEFGTVAVKRFYQDYVFTRKRLEEHPLSSPRELLLRDFNRPYRSAIIRKNWKIIYRYDKTCDRIFFVDLWDMRMNPQALIKNFNRRR